MKTFLYLTFTGRVVQGHVTSSPEVKMARYVSEEGGLFQNKYNYHS